MLYWMLVEKLTFGKVLMADWVFIIGQCWQYGSFSYGWLLMLPVERTEVVGCFWIRNYEKSERNWLWILCILDRASSWYLNKGRPTRCHLVGLPLYRIGCGWIWGSSWNLPGGTGNRKYLRIGVPTEILTCYIPDSWTSYYWEDFHLHTITYQYELYWYSWCWVGSLEFLWLGTVMRHSNVLLLFVINCNYETNFVDASTHTHIISGDGLCII